MRPIVPIVVLLVVAGCVGPDTNPEAAPASDAVWFSDPGVRAFEPSIAFTPDGTAFMNALSSAGEPAVWRSMDAGATWEELLDRDSRAPQSLDPWLWVDPSTSRVFSAELFGGCSWLIWSDDLGETWGRNPVGGCGLPPHHFQKLTGGPPPPGVATQGYASVLYYSATSLRDPDPSQPAEIIVGGTGSEISVSLDGGRTWGIPVQAHPPTPGGYSQAGPVAVAADGTAWSPAQTDDGVRIARSTDAGATWELVATLLDVGYQDHGSEPSLAAEPDGTLHLVHPSRESSTVLRTSQDGGVTWSTPRSLAPPGVNSTIFPQVRVLAQDTLVVAYMGTTADPTGWNADPSDAPPGTTWHLYLTLVENASTEDPRIVSIQAEEDPVQRGCIWMRGGFSSSCRNMGDFIGAAVHEGTFAVVFVDGCDACPAEGQSTARAARVAWWTPKTSTG